MEKTQHPDIEAARSVVALEIDEQGWTLRGLCAEAGVERDSFRRWLAGERESLQLRPLLNILGVLGRDYRWLAREMGRRQR